MARPSKPIALQSKHLTNEEKQARAAEEKALKGNSNKIYRPPKGMGKEEKIVYKEIVKELKEANILNNIDVYLLSILVDSIVKINQCKSKIDSKGILIETENSVIKNPAVNAQKDYTTIFYKACSELGLSPAARSKLAAINIQSKEDNEDPLLKALRDEE